MAALITANEDDASVGGVRPLRRQAIASLIACAMLVSSCALIKRPEAPRETYELSAPTSFSGLRGSTGAQILVKLPTSLDTINSERIVLRPSKSVITYVAGAQWSDTVPKMVQAKLVEAFENTGATGATAKPGEGLVIDYQLVSNLRRFEIANRVAIIEVSIKLLADRTGKVVETRVFTAEAPVSGDVPENYVAGFDAAFDDLSRAVIKWVLGAV